MGPLVRSDPTGRATLGSTATPTWTRQRSPLVRKAVRPGGHGLAQVPGLVGAKAQAGTSLRGATSTLGGGTAGSGKFITSNHRQVPLLGAAVFATQGATVRAVAQPLRGGGGCVPAPLERPGLEPSILGHRGQIAPPVFPLCV